MRKPKIRSKYNAEKIKESKLTKGIREKTAVEIIYTNTEILYLKLLPDTTNDKTYYSAQIQGVSM